MRGRHGRSLAFAVLLALGAYAPGPEAADAPVPSPTAASEPGPTPAIQDIMELEPFALVEPGTYFIDPDLDPSTPLRVVYEVRVEGWSQWISATKSSDDGHVMVSITTVTNLVRHGCRDHSWVDPPVGASVDDLATALADLAPFRVTSPPRDVTVYGYRGKYLELTVPNLPVEGPGDDRRFTGCEEGTLKSWVAAIDTEPGDAFCGYNAEPGRTEEFWILDVDNTLKGPETPAQAASSYSWMSPPSTLRLRTWPCPPRRVVGSGSRLGVFRPRPRCGLASL